MEEKLSLLKEYFEEYNVNVECLTDKEKIVVLNRIISCHNVDKELVELNFSKIPKEIRTNKETEEYINNIQNLDIRIIQALNYKEIMSAKIKRDKKQKRKDNFQKVLSIFKKTK